MDVHAEKSRSGPFWWTIILIAVLTGLAQVHIHERGLYAISVDESARTLLAADLDVASALQPNFWPPFCVIVNGAALKLHDDLFLTPRLLAGVAGLLTSLALLLLAHSLFRNRAITLVTGFLAVFCAHRLVFSVVPLSEIYFILFVTLGCALAFGWLVGRKDRRLVGASLAFFFSATIRYEGWLFCLALLIILAFERLVRRSLSRRAFLLNAGLLSLFPVYWLLFALLAGRMDAFTEAANRYAFLLDASFSDLWYRSFLYQFAEQALTSPLILGLIVLVCLCLLDRTVRAWSLLWLIPLIGMTLAGFVAHALPSHNWWRLASPELILLLPFVAYLVCQFCERLFERRSMRGVAIGLVTAIIALAFYHESADIAVRSAFTGADRDTGRRVAQLLQDGEEMVLVDSSIWSYLHVIVAAQHPERFVRNSGFDPHKPEPSIVRADRPIDFAELRRRNLRYLVFRDGALNERIAASNKALLLERIGAWNIYRVNES